MLKVKTFKTPNNTNMTISQTSSAVDNIIDWYKGQSEVYDALSKLRINPKTLNKDGLLDFNAIFTHLREIQSLLESLPDDLMNQDATNGNFLDGAFNPQNRKILVRLSPYEFEKTVFEKMRSRMQDELSPDTRLTDIFRLYEQVQHIDLCVEEDISVRRFIQNFIIERFEGFQLDGDEVDVTYINDNFDRLKFIVSGFDRNKRDPLESIDGVTYRDDPTESHDPNLSNRTYEVSGRPAIIEVWETVARDHHI